MTTTYAQQVQGFTAAIEAMVRDHYDEKLYDDYPDEDEREEKVKDAGEQFMSGSWRCLKERSPNELITIGQARFLFTHINDALSEADGDE